MKASNCATAAEQPASEKPKNKRYKPKPLIRLPDPQNADELLALSLKAVDRLRFEVSLRTGRARRRRTDLLRRKDPDLNALQEANGQLAWLGGLQWALMQRRTQLRVQARQARGQVPERHEAIAIAVDRLANGPFHARLMQEADQIVQQAAKDLGCHDPRCIETPPEHAALLPPSADPAAIRAAALAEARAADAAISDEALSAEYRAWWQASYGVPPNAQAVAIAVAWGRHLLSLPRRTGGGA